MHTFTHTHCKLWTHLHMGVHIHTSKYTCIHTYDFICLWWYFHPRLDMKAHKNTGKCGHGSTCIWHMDVKVCMCICSFRYVLVRINIFLSLYAKINSWVKTHGTTIICVYMYVCMHTYVCVHCTGTHLHVSECVHTHFWVYMPNQRWGAGVECHFQKK